MNRSLFALALLGLAAALPGAPALAQTTTADDPAGNFSRDIPPGLGEGLTEQERNTFQARLSAAQTPQERNQIRMEMQRLSQERQMQQNQMRQQQKKDDAMAKPGKNKQGGGKDKSGGGNNGGGGGGKKK